MVVTMEPRALPWAGISRPFGAERAISTMEVIGELIRLAKEMDAAAKRGEDLGLTDDEIALTPSLPLSRACAHRSALSVSLAPQRFGSTTPSPPTSPP